MIGNDKIKHYIKMKKDNDDLRFYLFYGFYDIDKEKQKIIKIVYKYLEITNEGCVSRNPIVEIL